MRRFIFVLAFLLLGAMLAAPVASAGGSTARSRERYTRVHDQRLLSPGAQLWADGPPQGSGEGPSGTTRNPTFGSNVDANDPTKDLAAGQSETAIAASGNLLLAAWNDASGFMAKNSLTPAGSLTGVGFSSDGGATFTDLIGLPNDNVNQAWFGDPTVVAIDATHFVVGSLYFPAFHAPRFCQGRLQIAVSVATVSGGSVSFSNPIAAVDGGPVCDRGTFFPDKPFLAYDASTRTIALSYTFFGFEPGVHCGNGEIHVVRGHVPADVTQLSEGNFSDDIVVAPEEGVHPDCNITGFSDIVFLQGSYPTVTDSGDVVVAYERNWISNLFNGFPYIYIKAASIPAGATHPTATVTVSKGEANATATGGVRSMDATQIVGYTRFIGNDFPRIAFKASTDRVLVVWNAASLHPLGDIFIKSLKTDLSNNDNATVSRVNDDDSWALHFLPAVSVADGDICTSWYDRRAHGASSSVTDYYGECRPQGGEDRPDFAISTGSTDWNGTGSFIDPNFGDYTDNASSGGTTYYLWTDGRIGVPQPFAGSHH